MTQEEKAKAYDEALGRAKEMCSIPTDKATMEYIFPQLRESDDERIRKGLVKLLTVASEAYLVESTGIKKEQFLSYLEKQKEQKQTDLPAGFYYIDLNGNRYYSKEFRYGDMKLKVGEQKPAWSEEDEDMLNSCISSIEEAKENRYAYKETDGDTSYDHEIAWLKSLRPQPNLAWSEEDNEMRLEAIRVLESGCERYRKESGCLPSWHNVIAWLKSLRPSWKPSEEQMAALDRCVDYLDESDNEDAGIIESLYEQLKKL